MITAGAVALSALGVVACGDDGHGSRGEQATEVRLAFERSARATRELGVRFRFSGRISQGGDSQRLRIRSTVDRKGREKYVTHLPSLGEIAQFTKGHAEYSPAELDDLGELPPGTLWLRTNLDRLGGKADALTSLRSSGPLAQIRALTRLTHDAHAVGPERVRGRPTTRYRLRLPLGELLDELDGGGRPLRYTEPARRAVLRYDAWIDSRHRPVRTRFRLTTPAQDVRITEDVTSLSRRFRVRVPHGRSVFDATERIRRTLGEAPE